MSDQQQKSELRWFFRCLLWLGGLAGSVVYRILFGILRRLPDPYAERLSRLTYAQVYRFVHPLRMGNIRMVFGPMGWPRSRCLELNRQWLRHQGRLGVELARMMTATPEELSQTLVLEGEDRLQTALQRGRGVLLIGCHLGNWFYITSLLSALGHAVSNVANPMPVPALENDLRRLRARFGIRTTPLGQGASKAAAEAFECNGVFSILIDICLRPEKGIRVPFGPAFLLADLGPARLALRHEVPVLLAFAERTGLQSARVCLLPSRLDPAAPGTKPSPEELTRCWVDQLAAEILKRPEQWLPWSTIRLQASPQKTADYVPSSVAR